MNTKRKCESSAKHEHRLMKKNWLLCCDLETLLLADNLLKDGKRYLGLLRRKLQSEGNIYGDQYEFEEVEVPLTACRRNIHVFLGRYITFTRRPDGSLRLNLRNIDLNNIDIDTFCLEMMIEIRQTLKSLIGNSKFV